MNRRQTRRVIGKLRTHRTYARLVSKDDGLARLFYLEYMFYERDLHNN